ncbi:MAG: glycosyltransferase family 4 protein, partial [Ferruginibacter sp.]
LQLPPPIHGASVINSQVISSKLLNSQFELGIINLKFSKSIHGLKVFSLTKVIKSLIYCFTIINRMITFRPKLVYFNLSTRGFAFYRDTLYVLLLKLFNSKIALHLHTKGIKHYAQNNLIKKFLFTLVFKNTAAICLSDILATDIETVYKRRPCIVPNGISLKTELNNKTNKIPNSIPQILYVSNYTQSKGILILIEALAILKQSGFKFQARLVGAAADLTIADIERLIKANHLDLCTKAIGPLFNDEKLQEFENADIFAFPTYNDAFPLVILEAMLFGLPIISTLEGSIPDIVSNNETGYLVETENPEKIADKLSILLLDPEKRIAMGKRGFERYQQNFTRNHFELNMLKTFNEILDKGN